MLGLLDRAAVARLALERHQGPGVVSRATDKAAAERVERQVTAAWIKWYAEAFDSVERLPVTVASDALKLRIAEAKRRLTTQ